MILSPSSVSSTNVEDEVAFALEEHKTVIPVFCRDCKVPFQLRPFQYVDFRTDYDRGLRTLLKTLGVVESASAGGGTAVSVVPKDTAADVPDAEERERAPAEQQRLEQEVKQTAEEARLEEQERERLATEERQRQLKLGQERQAATEQAHLQEESRPSAEMVQLEELGRRRKAAEEERHLVFSKKMIIGLGVGVVVVLVLLWMLWPRRSNNQALRTQTTVPQTQPQSTGPSPQEAQPQMQSTGRKPQTAVQQPRSSERKTPNTVQEPPAADNCPKGVYCDPDTKLMWAIADNGKDVTWQEADQYCKSLTLAGLSGWELPTIDELEKLYDPKNSIEYNIRKPLRLTGWWVWSSTKQGSGSASVFGFNLAERGVDSMAYTFRAHVCASFRNMIWVTLFPECGSHKVCSGTRLQADQRGRQIRV